MEDLLHAAKRLPDNIAKTWQARALVACNLPAQPVQRPTALLILLAALGQNHHKGQIRVPRLGDNAQITKGGWLMSRFTDGANKDCGVRPVCSVADLNRIVDWLCTEIAATDVEHVEIVNIINGWISRDETKMAEHVEKMREVIRT